MLTKPLTKYRFTALIFPRIYIKEYEDNYMSRKDDIINNSVPQKSVKEAPDSHPSANKTNLDKVENNNIHKAAPWKRAQLANCRKRKNLKNPIKILKMLKTIKKL